jgi:hypothetical protein
MPQGLGQMIQMLSALADIQNNRKKLELDKQQMQQQNDQFIQQMGVTKDDQHYRAVSKIMDQISAGGASAATAVHDLAPLLGLNQQDAQMFAHMAPNAQAALETAQAQQEQVHTQSMQNVLNNQLAGQAAMSPAARMRMQIEAANMSNTQHDSGQLSTSALISQMADRGASAITPGSPNYSADMAKRIGEGYMMQQATRETPQQFDQGQAFVNLGMGPAAASVKAGLTPDANAMLASQTNQADMLARMAEAHSRQSGNISDQVGGINALRAIAQDIADKKYADDRARDTLIRQYNALSRLLAGQGINVGGLAADGSDAPKQVGRLEGWLKAMQGINFPSATPSTPGRGGPLPGGVGGGAGGGGIGPRGY